MHLTVVQCSVSATLVSRSDDNKGFIFQFCIINVNVMTIGNPPTEGCVHEEWAGA
jgi:hypothetical protein